MGWNDNYDPSEYDASNPDSMRALADRALADSARVAAAKNPTPAPTAANPYPAPAHWSKRDQDWWDTLPAGECWDCGRDTKLVGKGLCNPCYRNDKY